MTSQQHQRVRQIFEAALERGADERQSFAAREASDDAVVQEEVLSLLEHHQRAGRFLDDPIVERVPELLAGEDTVLVAGARTRSLRGGSRHPRTRSR